MNPSNQEASGMELPPPLAEQAPVDPDGSDGGSAQSPEQPAGAERAPATGQRAAAASPMIPLPVPPSVPVAGQASDAAAAIPVQATPKLDEDDGDLIEKEWVNKAKQIVEKTRNDPYKQSEELTVFKADYMKKHYDKTIKVNR